MTREILYFCIVKKRHLVTGLVTLGCLCYLLMGVSGILLPPIHPLSEEKVVSGGGKIVGEWGLLDLHTTPWEHTTNGASRTISFLVKVAFPVDTPSIVTDDTRIVSFFKAYTGYFRILLIRHRKSDSLFPYHYFW